MTVKPIAGLRHVALFVERLELCVKFYAELLGMEIVWQPDDDNVYLSSGNDNLALHRTNKPMPALQQRLDHIGMVVTEAEQVDAWYELMLQHGVTIKAKPKTHRDGARSFYCEDPDGTVVQMIHFP